MGGHKNHVSTQRIAHSIIKLQRDHFYLCQINLWTFYWTFFEATKWLREKKPTTFYCLYKSVKDNKKGYMGVK